MDAFPVSQPPDEGYSEDPLNPPMSTSHSHGTLAVPRSAADLPAWLTRQMPGLPVTIKTQMAMALLDGLPTSVIAEIVQRLNPRLYIDFVQYLPAEVCLKILGYLDPTSLINVARSCRTWYDLALDQKLWEKLYHLEGWKIIPAEINSWEEMVNSGLKSGVPLGGQPSSGSHTHKKRAASQDEDDDDLEMVDVDVSVKHQDSIMGGSIFGSPASSFTSFKRAPSITASADWEMEGAGAATGSGSSSSSKGKAVDRAAIRRPKAKGKAPALARPANMPSALIPPCPGADSSNIVKSTLSTWDDRSEKYRINWKYLYTMRRKLETNWELGKYTNFQLPHPNFPEEGHQECIYSLQFNAEYLVSGSRDRTLRIWNMQTRRLARPPLSAHSGSVLCLQFDADPEEDLIVSGSSDSDVILWRFSTGQVIQRLRNAHTESVLNVRFDKRILVTCSKDKTIKIFNRRPLRYGDPGYPTTPDIVFQVPIHLKTYGYEPELPIVPAYTMIGCLEGHGAAVNAVQIHENEIVSASGDRHVKVWDWTQQICTRTIVGHNKGIACVQYDGRRIVSGSSDNEVKVFDRPTGLEVASLRAHTHLVRTVQAGFGDLPYSAEEDKMMARKVDEDYFKAVQAGTVTDNLDPRASRNRPRNAGSSKPEDITAFGAMLPPGGGGGKCGRIVSGSYDQSIIIWRRDKEGVWKDAHHLRQGEAAVAAQEQSSATTATQNAGGIPLHPSVRPPPLPQSLQPPIRPITSTHNSDPTTGTQTLHSDQSFIALIDFVVPRGVAQLQQALATYPTLLQFHSHLQAAIDREQSPFIRSQLRQTVSAALVRAQMSQNRAREQALQRLNSQLAAAHAAAHSVALAQNAAMAGAGPSNTNAGPAAGPSTTTNQGSTGSLTAPRPQGQVPRPSMPVPPPASLVPISTANAAQDTPATSQQPTTTGSAAAVAGQHVGQVPAAQGAAAPTPAHNPAPAAQQPQIPAQAPAQVPPQAPQPVAAQQAHHPHIAAVDNNPARVFKLQFDARRIICCSQTSVIVGWDFCNGDEELEVASRFFGTVE